jgi:hypothetical protein
VSWPRFLADEDLNQNLVRAVRRLEPQIEFATVSEQGLGSEPDDSILGYAAENGWLLVSHDVNTMKAAADDRLAAGQPFAGLFLVPQSRLIRLVAESLVLIWSASELE